MEIMYYSALLAINLVVTYGRIVAYNEEQELRHLGWSMLSLFGAIYSIVRLFQLA